MGDTIKKRLVLAGGSLVGVAASVLCASPASADLPPVTTPCENVGQHAPGTTGGSNWYMDCIPQYGLGKAEFTIKADGGDSSVHFPAGFDDLDSGSVTAVSSIDTSDGAAVADYFSTPAPTGGVLNLMKDSSRSTSSKQRYDAVMIYKIASVSAIPVSELPAACKVSTSVYSTAWKVTYVPAKITYTQTVGGKQWKFVITSAPGPLYMGLPLDPSNGYSNIDQTEDAENACAVDGTQSLYSSNDFDSLDPDLVAILFDHAYSSALLGVGSSIDSTLSPFPNEGQPDSSGEPSVGNLGSFARSGTSAPTGPALALTGVDAGPAGLLGGGFFATGLLFLGLRFGLVRRRRQAVVRRR